MESSDTRRVIAAGAIGNVLEWYDFAVYGYFAAAIGRAFFPKEDAVAQVLSAFGIFAVGYLMRPVGGALVGHIGDKFGRRAALSFSVMAMAIPTFIVGLLPGYATLGIVAPILLTLLRMIQGLSVGGEYTTSVVFMVEHAPTGRRGLIGALGCCGAVGGILLGSATGAILSAIVVPEAMAQWGWRIPFLMDWPWVSQATFCAVASKKCRERATIARRSSRPCANMGGCWPGWRASPCSTPSGSISCSSTS